jgi:hypothetical protein
MTFREDGHQEFPHPLSEASTSPCAPKKIMGKGGDFVYLYVSALIALGLTTLGNPRMHTAASSQPQPKPESK